MADKTSKLENLYNIDKTNKIAFVFPGQGAQYENMGKEFYDEYATARKIYGDCLANPTQFFGSIADFTATNVAQPAIFLTDLVAATLLAENGVTADGVAGFSLGELPAVAFGGLLPTKQAFELTQFRAAKMHQATIAQKGGMLAVLGLSDEIVNRICEDVGKAYPVNYNAPGQVVVAFFEGNWGDLAEFDGKSDNLGYSAEKSQNKAETVQSALIQAVKAAKGKTVPLAVAGAFHSPLMDGVSQDLSAFLENVTFAQPKLHIYANVSAKPYSLENAAELLAKQVNSPVLWKSTIENMIADGFTTFVETGPGKTLAGLIKKIAKNNENVRIYNVYDKKTLEEVLSNVK